MATHKKPLGQGVNRSASALAASAAQMPLPQQTPSEPYNPCTPKQPPEPLIMPSEPLVILFEDAYYVAVNKPEGLLVHKSAIDKHETQFLLQQLRDQIGCYVFPIHRLDKPTSGVIIFGKTPEAAATMQQQMEANNAQKVYVLVCRGYCAPSGIIDHPLKPIDDFKSKRKKLKPQAHSDELGIDPAHGKSSKPAQQAVTHFKCLATFELNAAIDRYPNSRFSLVEAQLHTGRKHQIRRHFKHLSHPIIGCPKYGKSKYNHYFAQHLAAPRLMLHAYRLSFVHPFTQAPLTITAKPTGAFAQLLARFAWQHALS